MTNSYLVFAHPNLSSSKVNKALLKGLSEAKKVQFCNLYDEYPHFKIDVEKEQKRILNTDTIFLQFPLYWYSSPSLLKEWIDQVLTYGFAFGSGSKLKGKKMGLVTTVGSPIEDYTESGNNILESNLLSPFKHTAHYCSLEFLPPLCFYGVESFKDLELENARKIYSEYLLKWS